MGWPYGTHGGEICTRFQLGHFKDRDRLRGLGLDVSIILNGVLMV